MRFLPLLAAAALTALPSGAAARDVSLLNASYDVTRELYRDVNAAFAATWRQKTGDTVTVNQAHGGSSKQARAVIEGLQADVVTMNQAIDIDAIAASGLLAPDWPARLPNHAAPFTSTIVFLVRAGNPKQIRDWDDLVKPGVVPVIPNPKTSGNGRYSYLGAWAYALRRSKGDQAAARAFVTKLFRAVPVLDTGGRAATTTFIRNGVGDVLLTFENEAHMAEAEGHAGRFTIVVPPLSILAETPVAVVDKIAVKHGTAALAAAYLQFLYTAEGQAIGARHHLRPTVPAALAQAAFPKLDLVPVSDLGGWPAVQKQHFADGGVFDQIFTPR
jgi:sulfate/thiosulfate-binding protein